MEEQDMQEVQEKLEKYQRADIARVLQQAKSSRTEDSSSRQTRDDFRPEELPDGAFVSPKHTPSHSASVSKSDPATFSSVAEVRFLNTLTISEPKQLLSHINIIILYALSFTRYRISIEDMGIRK